METERTVWCFGEHSVHRGVDWAVMTGEKEPTDGQVELDLDEARTWAACTRASTGNYKRQTGRAALDYFGVDQT